MGQIDPDPNFVRHLKELSSDLDCHFDDDHKRFVITCISESTHQPVAIYMIRNEDGSFKRPGPLDIDFIAAGDTWSDDYADSGKYCEDYMIQSRKNSMAEFRDRTKDDKLQLVRKFAGMQGDSSKVQPFARPTRKPTGKVF